MPQFCSVFRRSPSLKTIFALLLLSLFLLAVLKPETKLRSNYRSVDYLSFENYGLTEAEYHEEIVNIYYEKRKVR